MMGMESNVATRERLELNLRGENGARTPRCTYASSARHAGVVGMQQGIEESSPSGPKPCATPENKINVKAAMHHAGGAPAGSRAMWAQRAAAPPVLPRSSSARTKSVSSMHAHAPKAISATPAQQSFPGPADGSCNSSKAFRFLDQIWNVRMSLPAPCQKGLQNPILRLDTVL